MAVIAGEEIYNHKTSARFRNAAVALLNEGKIQGILFTPKTGGIGLNMVGANHILSLGSFYSEDYEAQAIGTGRSSNRANKRGGLPEKAKAEPLTPTLSRTRNLCLRTLRSS